MTPSDRTEQQKLSAAPIRFELGDEVIECKPLPFGEGCLWRDDFLGLQLEMFPEAMEQAQVTREDTERLMAEIELENPDGSANWKAEESARRAAKLIQEKTAKTVSARPIDFARMTLRFAGRALDLVCRFARISDEQREIIEEQMAYDLDRGMEQVNDALARCVGMTNPSKGTEATQAEKAAPAPELNGLSKSTL